MPKRREESGKLGLRKLSSQYFYDFLVLLQFSVERWLILGEKPIIYTLFLLQFYYHIYIILIFYVYIIDSISWCHLSLRYDKL